MLTNYQTCLRWNFHAEVLVLTSRCYGTVDELDKCFVMPKLEKKKTLCCMSLLIQCYAII